MKNLKKCAILSLPTIQRAHSNLSCWYEDKVTPVTGGCFALSPGFDSFNTGTTVNDQSKRHAVCIISHLPVKHVFDLMVANAVGPR